VDLAPASMHVCVMPHAILEGQVKVQVELGVKLNASLAQGLP